MKTAETQQSIEEFVKTNWTGPIQWDNEGFNAELYEEFCRCAVRFGELDSRTVTTGCFRQYGVLMWSVYVKSSTGTVRLNKLTDDAALLFAQTRVVATLPLVAPVVKFKTPTIERNFKENLGWVASHVSTPFYYDI